MARTDIAPHLLDWIERAKPYHPRWIQLLDPESPAYNPAYLPVVERLASGGGPEKTQPKADIEANRERLRRDLERRLLVMNCDYRGPRRLDCGCGGWATCFKGKGRPNEGGAITDRECLECVSSP